MASTTGGGLFAPSRQVQEVASLLRGGQPARGTEVLSLRFKNGCVRPRNVFLDGYVMTVTYYNKTDAEWDRPKIIPRFQPWRVGQLLSSYLVYVQPVTALIGDELGDGLFGSEYIWANTSEPWHTPKLTTILKQRTGQDLGQELGTLQYRHAAVSIGRRFVGNNFAKDYYKDETGDVEEPEVATEDPLEMSAGRGSAAGARRPLSQSWHRFLGLDSRRGDLRPNHQKRKGPEMEATLAKKNEVPLDRRADHANHHMQPVWSRSYCDTHSFYCSTDNAVDC
ncbi:hypothetical protein E4U34_004836 [Claviceps purpurea]|nr:hypothetical protein E4U37_005992 [Claviceps purpurea]KAG6216918.1 hypothetical protein E4U34_004836 [Claviceps purpurea]